MTYEEGSGVLVRRDVGGGPLADHRGKFGVIVRVVGGMREQDRSASKPIYKIRLDSGTEIGARHSELLPA